MLMKMRAVFSAIVTLAAVFITARASAQNYIFSVVPWGSEAEMKAMFEPLLDYIDLQTGETFDIVLYQSYDELVREISLGRVHFACLNAISYLKARRANANIRYIATSIRDYEGKDSDHYLGYVITHKDSGIKDFSGLKNKVFAFVDQTSSSGYKMPVAYMREQGLEPKTFFKKYFYLGDHDEVAKAVKNRVVDGGATWETSYRINKKRYGDVYRIIHTTPPIPNDAWVVSNRLPKRISDKLKEVLLSLDRNATTPLGAPVLNPATGIPEVGFAERDPGFYEQAASVLLFKE